MSTLHKIVIVALAMLLLISLLVACGDGDETEKPTPTQTPIDIPTVEPTQPTSDPSPQPTPTIQQPAKPEGTLTVAVGMISPNPYMGPFGNGANADRAWWAYAADYLLYEARDGSGYIPGLAEEWEVAPDNMSITFKLRQGVQFHSGWGTMTAEDVKFSIETAVAPPGECVEWRSLLGALVSRIETSGPYELTIYLTKPFPDDVLGYLCPSRQMAVGITSKKYYEQEGFATANRNLVFTGPYRVMEYTQTEKLVLEALDNHWRVVPEFKTLVFKEVPELSTRVAMIQAGEADIAKIVADQAVNLKGGKIDIVSIPGDWYLDVLLWGQWLPSVESYDPNLPWLDKRVREAMNLAINREEITDYLYSGYASPIGADRYTEWSEMLAARPYDPDRAKELLAEAGYPDGFDVEIWSLAMPLFPDMTDLLLAVVGYWDAIGLHAKIESMNVMAVYGDIVQRKTAGVAAGWPQVKMKKPNAKAYTVWAYSQNSRFPVYESEEFDELVEGYLGANTPQERDMFAEQMVRYFYDEYIMVPVVALDGLWAKSNRVQNWEPRTSNYFDLEYVTHADPLGTFRLFEP